MARRDPREPTVHRYPVRFTKSQLDVASRLLAGTGITTLSGLVHFAFAQLAKTTVGSPQEASPATNAPRTTDGDPELDVKF
jgi:hypothetical protein